jgi:transcriptional regulator
MPGMYIPAAFVETDAQVLAALMRDNAFATLVSAGPGGMIASHVPLLHDPAGGPSGTLLGHLARPNPQVAALEAGAELLAIFPGPHAYVSPGWYATKPAVPTWNYTAVHAYGRARVLPHEELEPLLRRLSETYEAGRAAPWRFEDQPAGFTGDMMRGIVGFALPIERLEGKAKLSQNRPAADRAGVVAGLTEAGDANSLAIAALMRAGGS